MIKRLLLIATLGTMLSGCFMAPLALIGPVTSGFSTASLIQSGMTSGANYMMKKKTGKTFTEHALDALVDDESLQQSFFPEDKVKKNSSRKK
jgi:hypothetical protein